MPKIRTLIVDDAARVRQELQAVLTFSGEVEIVGEAANGLEAIHQAEDLHPEVILMDLEMPVMDGYQATQQIKRQNPACRVVALTVHGYEAARQKAYQAGVDDFIVKGESIAALVAAILERK